MLKLAYAVRRKYVNSFFFAHYNRFKHVKVSTSWVGLDLELQCTDSATVNSQKEF